MEPVILHPLSVPVSISNDIRYANCFPGTAGSDAIALALEDTPALVLTKLNLEGCCFDDRNGPHLISAIEHSKALTHLNLQDRNLSSNILYRVCVAISYSKASLKYLNLGYNLSITERVVNKDVLAATHALRMLAVKLRATLNVLKLDKSHLDDKFAWVFARMFSPDAPIEELYLRKNGIGAIAKEELLAMWGRIPNLRIIDLSGDTDDNSSGEIQWRRGGNLKVNDGEHADVGLEGRVCLLHERLGTLRAHLARFIHMQIASSIRYSRVALNDHDVTTERGFVYT